MIQRILALRACWTAWSSVIAVGMASGVAWGQVAAPGPRQFDLVEVAGLALALEVPGWRNEISPPPSEAFVRVVQTRPDSLWTVDGGVTWWERCAGGGQLQAIDVAKYALVPADLQAADQLLAKPYIREWVACMRALWVGKGDAECAVRLSEQAAANTNREQAQVLFANLGARLLALAPQNRELSAMIYSKARPPAIGTALAAYRQLEAEKITAAHVFNPQSDSTPGTISFLPAGVLKVSGAAFDWEDFASLAGAEWDSDAKRGKLDLTFWDLKEDGRARQIRSSKQFSEADMSALIVSPDYHLVFRGRFTPSQIEGITRAKTLTAVLQVSSEANVDTFLSRPGSPTMGLLNQSGP